MNTIIKLITGWAAPVIIVFSYLFLIYAMDATFTIAMFTLLGGAIAMLIWFLFRELASHAAISRAIAVGEPDDVVARARSAVDHRLTTRAKLPFRIYEAIGMGLRGQWDESITALEALGPEVKPRWRLLAASGRIFAATELGDLDRARAALDDVVPLARRFGPTADVTLRECQARVRFVAGDLVGARPLFRALVDDMRLGPAPRAAALYYAARCEDDPVVARTLYERAIGLAPRTWIKPAAMSRLEL